MDMIPDQRGRDGSGPKDWTDITIFIVGNSGVGKTSLMNRLVYGSRRHWPKKAEQSGDTLQVTQKVVNYFGCKIELTFVDDYEEDDVDIYWRNYPPAIMLVYDIHEMRSFISLDKWWQRIERTYKAPLLGDCVLMVGNRADVGHSTKKITDQMAINWMAQKQIRAFLETSAKKPYNLDEAIKLLILSVWYRHRRLYGIAPIVYEEVLHALGDFGIGDEDVDNPGGAYAIHRGALAIDGVNDDSNSEDDDASASDDVSYIDEYGRACGIPNDGGANTADGANVNGVGADVNDNGADANGDGVNVNGAHVDSGCGGGGSVDCNGVADDGRGNARDDSGGGGSSCVHGDKSEADGAFSDGSTNGDVSSGNCHGGGGVDGAANGKRC